jgi:hypothetical protein
VDQVALRLLDVEVDLVLADLVIVYQERVPHEWMPKIALNMRHLSGLMISVLPAALV